MLIGCKQKRHIKCNGNFFNLIFNSCKIILSQNVVNEIDFTLTNAKIKSSTLLLDVIYSTWWKISFHIIWNIYIRIAVQRENIDIV